MIAEIDTDGSGTVDFDGMESLRKLSPISIDHSFLEFMEMMSGE